MARRVQFGTTWWGKQWIDALTHLDYENRLPRGRTYYNTGRIDDMQFNPAKLRVEAIAHGSAYSPYEVAIDLKPLPSEDVTRLVDAVAERPALLAKLLEGELDPEVGEIAAELGISLFPQSWREFRMSCSCPDDAVPCKHIAGVYYGMVKTIDADPMWVFHFRGVDLPGLLRDRGIDLDKSVSLFEPDPLVWLALADPKGEAEEGDGEALPLLEEIEGGYLKRLASLLPASVEGGKALSRYRYEKLVAPVMSRSRSHEGQGHDVDELWNKFQSAFSGGRVLPELLWADGRFMMSLRIPRGRSLDASMMDRGRLIISLSELDGRTPASAPGLEPWSRVAKAAVMLLRQGAAVPVLVHLKTEGRDKVAAMWMPAMQAVGVRRFVEETGAILSKDVLGIFKKSGCPLAQSTRTGRLFTLLSVLMTEYVEFSARVPSSFAGDPLYALMARPLSSALDYGIAQADITLMRKFLKPFSLAFMQLSWVPVMTVRTAKNGNVTVNLGVLPRNAGPKARPVLYRDVLKEEKFEADRLAILSVFESLAVYCNELRAVLDSKGKPATLPKDGLRDFLFDAVPSLELLGARVMLPKSLSNLLKPKLSVSMSGSTGKGMITKESVGSFDWKVSLGERVLTKEEFEAVMAHVGEVIPFNDEFVYLDPEVLRKLKAKVDFMESAGYLDMMKAVYTGELDDGTAVSVPDDLIERTREFGRVDSVPLPSGLNAVLRPYQERGYSWLMRNLMLGLGALIADDMGLGKTLQVITTLLAMKERGEFAKEKAIAIVPSTLMTNWMREIERFAPGLTASVYHGSARQLAPVEERPDVTITTYGTFKRDAAVLGAETWRLMVLDEAQAVKNTGSGITQAVRDFPARQVIAMSGTPVENRLMEYWSLLSIVQPGILGTQDEFMKSFAKPIETDRNERALEAFRLVTAPFMLRRLKTDKSIISDLPDRVVCDRYVDLTPEQAALYKTTLDYWMKKLEGLGQEDGMKRSSMLLSLITALKQICNSPSLYEKRHPRLPDSGKADSLFELVEECRENGRKMLVFTQYAEMGERLQDWFEKATGVRPDFLHGGVSIAKRAEMVDRFQNDPADALLIISLKAGGTGLNLTAASVVVHYDLWWNPAVENQATDRAFRIGQCRDVLVYRFLCAGTFEERINDMLERKRELADLTVATGEGWVGDLSTDELKALFRLESPENA